MADSSLRFAAAPAARGAYAACFAAQRIRRSYDVMRHVTCCRRHVHVERCARVAHAQKGECQRRAKDTTLILIRHDVARCLPPPHFAGASRHALFDSAMRAYASVCAMMRDMLIIA